MLLDKSFSIASAVFGSKFIYRQFRRFSQKSKGAGCRVQHRHRIARYAVSPSKAIL